MSYNDRISHAFAFAAKYRSPRAPVEGEMSFVAHPSNVAVILARHGADDVTVIAGILHHVLEATPLPDQADIAKKIGDKFGSIVLAVARDAQEPHFDLQGKPLPWTQRKRMLLTQLLVMDPRALDICCADEIHQCGAAISTIERLGAEYLDIHGLPSGPNAVGWYDDLLEALDRRLDWPHRGMCETMRGLKSELEQAVTD